MGDRTDKAVRGDGKGLGVGDASCEVVETAKIKNDVLSCWFPRLVHIYRHFREHIAVMRLLIGTCYIIVIVAIK